MMRIETIEREWSAMVEKEWAYHVSDFGQFAKDNMSDLIDQAKMWKQTAVDLAISLLEDDARDVFEEDIVRNLAELNADEASRFSVPEINPEDIDSMLFGSPNGC